MSRERYLPAIRYLRDVEGLQWKDIAQQLGLGRSTVHAYYSDPDRSKEWARKHRAVCDSCGGVVNTSNGAWGGLCRDCVKVWTREAVILAIQEWADEHGGIPPSQLDWNRFNPNASPEQKALATELMARGAIPSVQTVKTVFGSWNAGIEAAGFVPRYRHVGDEARREAVQRVSAGESREVVAAELGVSVSAVALWRKQARYNPEKAA